MTRTLAAGMLALSLALGGMAATATFAEAGSTKVCRYKLSTGKIKSWTCGKDQPCCASETFNLFTCGSQMLQCF
jgi:hypothetical protein